MPDGVPDEVKNIYKPAGVSSFDCLRALRREYPRVKMGHAGTLDPFASGVLLVAFGKKTREISSLQKLEKEYRAVVKLGVLSTTYDPEGVKIAVVPKLDGVFEQYRDFFPKFMPQKNVAVPIPRRRIEDVLQHFVGSIMQLPPAFSAKKVAGERAYALARRGVVPKLSPKRVEIYSIELLQYYWPELVLKIVCGSGVYIRSLAYDIGKELGCGAYVTELERSRIGNFHVDDATRIDI